MGDNISSQNLASFKDVEYSSVLRVRLDTNPLVDNYEIYLTGKLIVQEIDEKTNKPKLVIKQLSKPKANDEGIHWILNKLKLIVNPSTVQGNFQTMDMYYNYIFEVRSSLLYNLMKNLYIWGIQPHDYEPIIDNFMDVVSAFMTRPVGNKERDSYGGLKVVESTTTEQRSKGFNLNPFNKGG